MPGSSCPAASAQCGPRTVVLGDHPSGRGSCPCDDVAMTRSTSHGRLQLRRRAVRGFSAARGRQLLPLPPLPAQERRGRIPERPPCPGHVPNRQGRGPAARLEAGRRRREVVLRRLRLLPLWTQPQPRRPDRDPHGHLRPGPRDPSERTSVRQVCSPMGNDPRRRVAAASRQSPHHSIAPAATRAALAVLARDRNVPHSRCACGQRVPVDWRGGAFVAGQQLACLCSSRARAVLVA